MINSTSNKIWTLLFTLLKCLLGPWCILLHLLTRGPMGKQSTKSSIRPATTTCPFWKLDNQFILALCTWASKVCIFILPTYLHTQNEYIRCYLEDSIQNFRSAHHSKQTINHWTLFFQDPKGQLILEFWPEFWWESNIHATFPFFNNLKIYRLLTYFSEPIYIPELVTQTVHLILPDFLS